MDYIIYDGMIALGDKICLDGFDDLGPASLIVVKKMVGSFAKKLAEEKGYDKLIIIKEGEDISVKSIKGDSEYEGKSSDANIFFGLGKSFEEMTNKY